MQIIPTVGKLGHAVLHSAATYRIVTDSASVCFYENGLLKSFGFPYPQVLQT